MSATAAPFTLRPLGLGELLDQSFWLYRQNFWLIVAVALAIQLPTTLLQMVLYALNPTIWSTTFYGTVTPAAIIPVAISYLEWLFVFNSFTLAALIMLCHDLYLRRSARLADAFWQMAQNWRRWASVPFIHLTIVVVLATWALVPVIGWLTAPGLLFFYHLVVVPLTVPVVVVEARSTTASVRRSWDMARRRFWPVLWALLVVFSLSLAVFISATSVPDALLGLLRPAGAPVSLTFGERIPYLLLGWVLWALIIPLEAMTVTAIYFDLRVRLEGLDLNLAATDWGQGQGAVILSVPESAVTPSPRLISIRELSRFGLLTFGAALFLLLAAVAYVLPPLAAAIIMRPPG